MTPDDYNKKVLAELSAIRKTVEQIQKQLAGGSRSAPSDDGEKQVASDSDLDSSHGDPSIRFMPREKYWKGEDFTGYRLSETTPEFLEAYAKYLDACAYMASQDPDEKKRSGARWKAKDAARCRGWQRRLLAGWKPPATAPMSNDAGNLGYDNDNTNGQSFSDDDIPF